MTNPPVEVEQVENPVIDKASALLQEITKAAPTMTAKEKKGLKRILLTLSRVVDIL